MLFTPVHPPRNPDECAGWLHEAIKRLNRHATDSNQGFGAILRGEAPDSSGNSLIDLTRFFVKPGLGGGQIAYGGINANENLTLSSTINADKGFIYLGSAQTSMFDEDNQRLGLATTPLFRLHQKHTSAVSEIMQRWEGPGTSIAGCVSSGTSTVTSAALFGNVTIGMVVTGSLVPSGVTVTGWASASSITLSANIASGTTTMTFADKADFGFDANGEFQWKGSRALNLIMTGGITPTTDSGIRMIAAGAGTSFSNLARGWVQGGPTNLNLTFTGHNGATGNSAWTLFNYTSFNTWGGVNTDFTNNARVGINIDPFDYSSSAATAQPGSLLIARMAGASANVPSAAVEGSTASTEMAIAVRGVSGGSRPSRTIGVSNWAGFRHDGEMILANNGNLRGIFSANVTVEGAGTTTFRVTETANTLNVLRVGKVSAWGDTLTEAQNTYFMFGDLSGTHRSVQLCSTGFSILTRFGISSKYTLISNGQVGGASGAFPAPEASPTVLYLLNTSTAGLDASVVCKIHSNRAAQSGNLLQLISGVTSTVDTAWNGRNVMATGRIKTSVLFTDDNATIASAKLVGLNLDLLTAGQTRTLSVTDASGTIATDKNVTVDDLGDIVTLDGELVLS